MRESEYLAIYSAEGSHWWYAGLKDLVAESLKGRLAPGAGRVLDAGCGTGGMLKRLSEERYDAVGVDYSGIAVSFCRERGLGRIVRGSVGELPFKDASFDAVVSLDVIYHSAVADDLAALKEFARVLKRGGTLIMNLPAYEFLRSPHDLANFTSRRYTTGRLTKALRAAGFSHSRVTYRNTFLFPAIAAVKLGRRLLSGGSPSRESDLGQVNPAVNRLLKAVLAVENRLLGRFCLPFGSSVFCVARRDD